MRADRASLALGCLLLLPGISPAAAAPAPETVAPGPPAASAPRVPPTDDEVFERVFKRRPGLERERVSVPLLIDGEDQGPILIDLVAGGRELILPADAVVAALASRMRGDPRREAEAAIKEHKITADALRALGLAVTFDARRLELRVAIPPELRETAVHELQGSRVPAEAARALRPSAASGYLNVRGGGGVIRSTGELASHRTPMHLNLDSALNVHGYVLEGRADFAEGPDAAHRGDVLLSHDDPDRALRLLAGDFPAPGTTFQPSFQQLGLGVLRSFALQPYRLIQPAGQFDFLLDRPSQVTVFVNGARVQTLNLSAGRHDVRDLPLSAGVNDLELVIRDDRGLERRLSFATATAGGLLEPGLSQFAYSIGLPLVDDHGARSYDAARPVLSLQHRLGILPRLTIGGRLDLSLERQVASNQLVVASAFGNLGLDLAASHDGDLGAGFAAGLRYDYLLAEGGTATRASFTVLAQHRSGGFRALGLQPSNRRYSDEFSALVSGKLWKGTFGGASLRYEVGRDVADAQEASLTMSRSFGASLGLDASVSGRRGGAELEQLRLMVSAHWTLPDHRGSIHSSSRASSLDGPSNQATWSYRSLRSADGLGASATIAESASDFAAAGSLDYTGYRFTSALATSATMVGGTATQTAGVELGTALVFAGGEVGWSRPITGSFVLVARNDTLAGHPVGVNPALGAYDAKADILGVAVVPNLQPYTVSSVHVDAPDIPDGVSLGPSSYWLLPSYKSGTVIRVGEDGTVFVRGVLRNADDSPVALATAEVFAAGDGGRAPIVLLTNRAGRFGLQGLRPGRYEIRLAGRNDPPIPFEIPPGYAGLFSAGELRVPAAPR